MKKYKIKIISQTQKAKNPKSKTPKTKKKT